MGTGERDSWHQPSACRAGRDPMQEKDGVPQPSPSLFASHSIFPLSFGSFCKESSGTHTAVLELSPSLLHKSQICFLGLNGVWRTLKVWQEQAQ